MMKKEQYFNLETIDEESRILLREIDSFRKKHKILFNPFKSALLVLDMQRYFLNPDSHAFIPSAIAIIPKVKPLVEEFRFKNLPVIFTRHLNSNSDAGLMKTWWRELITEDNPESEIIPDLRYNDVKIIRKHQYDAFYQTSLEEILREKNVQQLVVTGVMTHLCVESTIRSAFIRGFKVFLPVDATATYSRMFHLSSLINLSHGFAIPVLTKEIIELLKEEHGNGL